LDIGEWYDLIAIALCVAAIWYEKKKEYAFSTIAMHVMRSCM